MEKLQELLVKLALVNTSPEVQCSLQGYSKECPCAKCASITAEEADWDWSEDRPRPSRKANAATYTRVKDEDAITAALALCEGEGTLAELNHRAWVVADRLEWEINPTQVIEEALDGRLLERL